LAAAVVAVVAVVGAGVFASATQPAFACSNIWEPTPTASPAPGSSPQPGYVQPDMGNTHVAVGTVVPWRDAGSFGPGFAFSAEGRVSLPGEDDPRAQLRTVSPGFFAALGVPIIAGRDFNESDRRDSESVVIVSQTLAQRLFPNQEVVNRRLMWTDPIMKFIDVSTAPRRIVGVAADVDDEHVVPGPMVTVYHPFEQQEIWGGRLFVHTRTDPYALVPPITRLVRDLATDQPVERAATLVEQALAGVARALYDAGVRVFVVAGGETSGAVVEALGARALAIGPEIDPGVPWTRAVAGPPSWLALKSGNFGSDDFFVRATAALRA